MFKKYLPLIILITISSLSHYHLLTNKKIFYNEDIFLQNYPQRLYYSAHIKDGIFPLWSPEISCGHPIFAEGQSGILYPFNIIYIFLPGTLAFNLSIILHLFLGGYFIFLIGNNLKFDLLSSLVSSIIFMFNGFIFAHINHTNLFNAYIWLPLIFYLILIGEQKKKIIYPVLSGFVFGMQILTAHIQTSFYTLFAVMVYLLILLL